MRFLSIYKCVERSTPPSQEEMCKVGQAIEEGMKSGKLLATEGCLPTSMGARLRISNGNISVTDGPFTESKEVIGGFAILNAESKEEALQMAKEFLQMMGEGETEVRQLFDAPQAVQQNYDTLAKLKAQGAQS
jgi:hypothetical protein